MTRIQNDPAAFRSDLLAGFVDAYARYVQQVPGASGVVVRGGPPAGRVSLVIGGGSGHYPAFCGLVGAGLATAAVVGDVFSSPSAEQVYRVGRAADAGAGVLFGVVNYAGDVMNFGQAAARLRADGVDARLVLVTDDVASAPAAETERRRGVAGSLVVFKVAGAAAARGQALDEVERLAAAANAVTRTFGVAFAGCTLPGRAEPLFEVAPDDMEVGLGIHGEPGVATVRRLPAAELADLLVERLLAERPDGPAGRVAVLLNGLGATSYEELFVLWRAVGPLLRAAGLRPVLPEVGEFVTSLDLAGCSLTLGFLDAQLAALWADPADTPTFRRVAPGTPSASTPVPASVPAAEPAVDQAGRPSGRIRASAGATAPAASTPGAGEARGAPARTPERSDPPLAGSAAPEQPVTPPAAPRPTPAAVAAAAVARRCLAAAERELRARERELGELDSVAGDGDHGAAMVRGAAAAAATAAAPELGLRAVLAAAGSAWADAGGGASGALWGALLAAAAGALDDGRSPVATDAGSAARAAADAVGRLGGVAVGDKTLLDALDPFARTVSGELQRGTPVARAWAVAARAATEAAVATRDLTPRAGRARPLADRSHGHPDPGAVSFALVVTAIGAELGQPAAAG